MKSFGNLILMTLICVIVFIVFMALHKSAKAQAPTPAQGQWLFAIKGCK